MGFSFKKQSVCWKPSKGDSKQMAQAICLACEQCR